MAIVQAYFSDKARPYLKVELRKASQSVRVAVAWFTDESLMAELMDLKYQHRRLSVQVLISNSKINFENPRNLERMQSSGIDLRVMRDEAPFLHHKFCLIDDAMLINGSYNWTYNAANKNAENITVIRPDTPDDKLISDFREQFLLHFGEEFSRPFSSAIRVSESLPGFMSNEHEEIKLRMEFQQRVQHSIESIDQINPTRPRKEQIHVDLLHDMMKRYGDGAAMVEKLIREESIRNEKGLLQPKSGFKKLVEWGRQRDLSFESLVLKPEFDRLFSKGVKDTARQLLR